MNNKVIKIISLIYYIIFFIDLGLQIKFEGYISTFVDGFIIRYKFFYFFGQSYKFIGR